MPLKRLRNNPHVADSKISSFGTSKKGSSLNKNNNQGGNQNGKFIPARPAYAGIRKYHTVLTHRMHWDEIVAYVLFLLFGHLRGIDISEAKIEFIKNNRLPDGKTVKELDAEGYLLLGEGGGRFDEHGRKDADKTCCAMLVAVYLNVHNHPLLKGFLQEVVEFDRNPNATKTCLANVMKEAFVARRRPVEKIIYWAIAAATDLVKWHMAKGSTVTVDVDSYNGVFLKAWNDAAERQVWDDDMYARAVKDFSASTQNARVLYTELSMVYYVMTAVSGKDEADYWLEQAAFDTIRYQEIWFRARNEFLKNALVLKSQAFVDNETRDIRIGYIVSDSEVMVSVWRSTEAVKCFGRLDVMIQKRRTGNVAIFLNHSSKLHSDDLVRMLRWAEIDLSGRKLPKWETLAVEEIHSDAPEWYYHRSKELGRSAVYNGSLSHPHVIPTRISVQGLQDIARHAFHPDGVRIWRRDHNAFNKVYVQKCKHRPAHADAKHSVDPKTNVAKGPSKESLERQEVIGKILDGDTGTVSAIVGTAAAPEVPQAETQS